MFIVWGTYHRKNKLGVVAERCPACQSIEPCKLTEHREVPHLYFIPLSRGTPKGTTCRCTACKTEFNAPSNCYGEKLTESAAQFLTPDELLARTNPELAESVTRWQELEAAAQQERRSGRGGETGTARYLLACDKLREDDSEAAVELMARLREWPCLEDYERDALLAEVDEQADTRQRLQRAFQFLKASARKFPHLAGFLSGLVVLVAGVFPLGWFQATQTWLWGTLIVLAALIAGLLTLGCVRAMRVERWFRRHLVPQALRNGVDPGDLVGLLNAVDRSNKGIDERIRDMAGEVESLARLVAEKEFSHPSDALAA